jgi:hypothetical protein
MRSAAQQLADHKKFCKVEACDTCKGLNYLLEAEKVGLEPAIERISKKGCNLCTCFHMPDQWNKLDFEYSYSSWGDNRKYKYLCKLRYCNCKGKEMKIYRCRCDNGISWILMSADDRKAISLLVETKSLGLLKEFFSKHRNRHYDKFIPFTCNCEGFEELEETKGRNWGTIFKLTHCELLYCQRCGSSFELDKEKKVWRRMPKDEKLLQLMKNGDLKGMNDLYNQLWKEEEENGGEKGEEKKEEEEESSKKKKQKTVHLKEEEEETRSPESPINGIPQNGLEAPVDLLIDSSMPNLVVDDSPSSSSSSSPVLLEEQDKILYLFQFKEIFGKIPANFEEVSEAFELTKNKYNVKLDKVYPLPPKYSCYGGEPHQFIGPLQCKCWCEFVRCINCGYAFSQVYRYFLTNGFIQCTRNALITNDNVVLHWKPQKYQQDFIDHFNNHVKEINPLKMELKDKRKILMEKAKQLEELKKELDVLDKDFKSEHGKLKESTDKMLKEAKMKFVDN